MQVIGGRLRLGRGAEDGALVLLHDLEPARKVRCAFGPDSGCDFEVRAEEASRNFGDQFLEMVLGIALVGALETVKTLARS
jgi:hypothetical protein